MIPASGEAAGTVRMLDAVAWADAEHLIRQLITAIVPLADTAGAFDTLASGEAMKVLIDCQAGAA